MVSIKFSGQFEITLTTLKQGGKPSMLMSIEGETARRSIINNDEHFDRSPWRWQRMSKLSAFSPTFCFSSTK
ncbi:MAG: hypothetical protein CMJ78_10575 [Planctomycetaceae bacterium]|nr:hypothetical protein [Planctomycetaceae bacterium]